MSEQRPDAGRGADGPGDAAGPVPEGMGGRPSGPSFAPPPDHRPLPGGFGPLSDADRPSGGVPPSTASPAAAHPSPAEPASSSTGRPTAAGQPPTGPFPGPPFPGPPGLAPERPAGPRPRGNRLATWLTVVAVIVVAAVVAFASLLAARSDRTPTPPPASPSASETPTAPSSASDRIEFTTPYGDGELVVVRSSWSREGEPPPSDDYLDVVVELTCRSGQVDVAPDSFQLLDAAGTPFEVSDADRPGTPLDIISLYAGDKVRGRITFDVPRGDMTLLFSVASESTALKIPG